MTPGRGFRWVRVGERFRSEDQRFSTLFDEWMDMGTFMPGEKCRFSQLYRRRRTATRKTKGRA